MNPYGRTFKTRKGAENLAKRDAAYAWQSDAILQVVEVAEGFIVNWINPTDCNCGSTVKGA